jgi:predicted NAD/FAD-binding protein
VQLLDRPQWYTVSRRSREYVRRIVATLPPERSTVLVGTPVRAVSYLESEGRTEVVIETSTGVKETFDHVIFGAHPDQALGMLTRPAPEHAAALKNFLYQSNRAYLHKDERLMPKNKQAWSRYGLHLFLEKIPRACYVTPTSVQLELHWQI